MRVLLDTNIVIDFLQKREPYFKDVEQIFNLCVSGEADGFITASSCTDIYYFSRKVTKSANKAKVIMANLFMLVGVLDTKGMDCFNALFSSMKDFEDAVIVETASNQQIDYIVTRNLKNFKEATIEVLSPKEFIKKA